MSEYILILVWIGFVALLANQFNFKREEVVCGKRVQRFMPWFAFFAFAPVIWMAGNRGWIGDTWAYYSVFKEMPDSLLEIPVYIIGVEKDVGFYVFSAIIKSVISNDSVVYFTILALIQGSALVFVFRKYSINYILSIFLFLISTDYLSWMFNGIRQFMAVIMIFAATELMLKRRYVLLVFMILLAATMHQSALVMLPLVFVSQGKAWNKKTLFFISLSLLAVLFVGQFTNLLEGALLDTQYENSLLNADLYNDDGTNPIRVLVYSVPVVLAFAGRKIIREEKSPIIHLCVNMSIISAGLYIVSMVTSGVFLGRLPIYVSLYNYILLPWEVENLFTKASKKVVYTVLLICYCLFYYYQLHGSWGLI